MATIGAVSFILGQQDALLIAEMRLWREQENTRGESCVREHPARRSTRARIRMGYHACSWLPGPQARGD